MNGWVKVGTRSELLPTEFRVVWDGDTAIAVYNIDGDLYAIEDVCTHDGGELAGGPVHGFEGNACGTARASTCARAMLHARRPTSPSLCSR